MLKACLCTSSIYRVYVPFFKKLPVSLYYYVSFKRFYIRLDQFYSCEDVNFTGDVHPCDPFFLYLAALLTIHITNIIEKSVTYTRQCLAFACYTYFDTGYPLMMVTSEDPWKSHLLKSGDRTLIFCMQKGRSTNWATVAVIT